MPVAYGHREVLIRGYVDEVVISCGAEVIARHRRSYDSEDLIFDPRVMIVALARKLAIALWRYLETGLIPVGAVVK